MEILLKLRILIWVLALGLWGHILYQFIAEEEPSAIERMHSIPNPFPQRPLPTPPSLVPPLTNLQAPQTPIASASSMATSAPLGNFIKPMPLPNTQMAPERMPAPSTPVDESIRRHEFGPLQETLPIPKGFERVESDHFIVYFEGEKNTETFLSTLESLHANLMLDLAAFSPWANDEKISIYLFRNQNTYHQITGRPAWSGGASSVSHRTIYLYTSEEMIGILAHEMTHVYFDGYFLDGHPNPLWLSEGMATTIQVDRGLSRPNWLPENLSILRQGGGFRFSDFMRVTSTAGANDDNVRLWYAEAYSVVRFLLRLQGHSSFFHFCRYLKEGEHLHTALYRAYGMPFNRVQALEYAWRAHFKSYQPNQRHAVLAPQPYSD